MSRPAVFILKQIVRGIVLLAFGLLTLGSGVCTAAFLPYLGDLYVGWLPLFIGLPVFIVSVLVTRAAWRTFRAGRSEFQQTKD
jgi:hypothetical protein